MPRKCLIIERHAWETGGKEQQLQIPLAVANRFFGSGSALRTITVRVFLPPSAQSPAFQKNVSISRDYPNGTRRINGFPEIGDLPSCFIFFEETSNPGVYNVWWQQDKAIIAARFNGWQQGKSSQYGRGRLAIIVPAPVQRQISQT
jgi:hypothetical protein